MDKNQKAEIEERIAIRDAKALAKRKADWFDTHVEVIGVSDSFAEKVKAKLRLEVARKYGHKHGCECPFCRGAMVKLERDADE